jgi:signal transduction histidine kinase
MSQQLSPLKPHRAPPHPRDLAQRLRGSVATAIHSWRHEDDIIAKDPTFATVRRRMTLWYTAALALVLLLAVLLLYFAMQESLEGAVSSRLSSQAALLGVRWQQQWTQVAGAVCPIENSVSVTVPYVACFNQSGILAIENQPTSGFRSFITPDLARAALARSSGAATDTINGGSGLGAIRRYAIVVRDPTGPGILGVVQVGEPIQGELDTMRQVLTLLILLSVVIVAGSALTGRWLAGRALQPARQAFERQRAFIADASHELRTPLTLMRADAEVLLRGRDRLDPDDAALLDDIVAETAHMATLATNMLALARLDAGALRVERDVVDLARIGADTLHRAGALAAEKRVRLDERIAGPALVIGDPALLEQAVLILLDNAIKYNQAGGSVTLTVATAGPWTRLEVADSGPGIPAEHLARLGERFFRVDKARSREMGGAGLGLSIARGIAQAHGGTLALSSVQGQGTAATLFLPAVHATPRALPPEASPV